VINMAEKKKRRRPGAAKVDKILAQVDRALQRAKQYATPLQWARIHETQARVATARGKKQKVNRGKRSGGGSPLTIVNE
jgi:hypothetical protein